MIRKVLALLLVLIVCLNMKAQNTNSSQPWDQFMEEGAVVFSSFDTDYYLLQASDLLNLAELEREGWSVVRRLDQYSAIVSSTKSRDATNLTQGIEIFVVNDRWKLSPNLLIYEWPASIGTYMIKSTNVEATQEYLFIAKVDVSALGRGVLKVGKVNASVLSELLGRPEIIYIGKESQDVREESRVLDMNLNPNRINQIHHEFPNLNGQGMVLSIRESGYNTEDIDLRMRHLPSSLQAENNSNHATEMATVAGGAGNSSRNGRGVAGEVTLTSSFLSALFPDESSDYRGLEAWVQNHSYGTEEVENFYGAAAEAYDLSANENPTLLHVFSVGNQGTVAPITGAYAGLSSTANVTGNFKMSKNSLVVASVDTTGHTVDFVSRGPAHDGRIKPELSTYSVAGSSNSAAMVSGAAILLQQAHQEIHGAVPASALLKALLLNGAKDVATPGPDFVTGYGNMDAYQSLQSLQAGQFASQEITQGEEDFIDIQIPTGAINLKVMLAWNDPAASPNANLALVNDLELEVTDAMGQAWLPWVLDASPEALMNAAVRGEDHLNNLEQVTIPAPELGNLSIKVRGFNVSQGPQRYHIVWQWEQAGQFDWTFPTGSDNMPYNGETVSYFRWDSNLAATSGNLEYSTDGGGSWEPIANDLDLSKGYFRWDAPDLKTAALARMVADGQSYVSDQFTISRPERISVGFSCADSVRIQWANVLEAQSYEVLTIDGASMRQVAVVTDTAFTFTKSGFETRSFAVQPVLANGVRPIRSSTFDYDFQGVGCYLFSFSTEISPEEGMHLNVGLGTTAGITGMEVLRQVEEGDFDVIQTLGVEEVTRAMRLLDASPFQGLNSYRVRLFFENGEQLLSEISSAYFLTTRPFLVFPNPLSRGEQLNVFSKEFEEGEEVNLRLYDYAGNSAFQIKLFSDRFAFDLSDLPRGMYFYRIATNSGLKQTGRLILN